jgi:hypothetical protein
MIRCDKVGFQICALELTAVRIAVTLSTGTDVKKKPEYEQMTTFA